MFNSLVRKSRSNGDLGCPDSKGYMVEFYFIINFHKFRKVSKEYKPKTVLYENSVSRPFRAEN